MEFNPSKHFLALDFDGVIDDSIAECFVVAHNAFVEFRGGKRITRFSDLSAESVKKQRALRNFIRTGEDYVYILLALAENVQVNNQVDFDTFTQQYQNLRNEFIRLFYQEREQLSEHKRSQWIALNPLYEGMKDYLTSYPAKDRLCIITTKRTSFVDIIFREHNIPVPPDMQFHANKDRSKRQIIVELLEKLNIKPESFNFVDDQVDTLIKVMDTGVNCVLATWGYNTPEQVELALKNEIPALSLDQFYKQFSF